MEDVHTEKRMERRLQLTATGGEYCSHHSSIDGWKSFFERILCLLAWIQGARWLRRGDFWDSAGLSC